MPGFEELLAARRVLVADGAWGTLLAEKGLPPGGAPELWNLQNPEVVREVTASYVAAGSEIVLTNTFGGSRVKLARAGMAGETAELNRRGAELSVEAAAGRALVFASVGPLGEMLEPYGPVSEKEARAAFAEQVGALAAAGVEGIVIETMTDLNEARIALAAAREACALPVVACMTFEKGPGGIATIMGVRPETAAEELAGGGARAVGANCGSGIERMIEVAGLMRPVTGLPLWMKPNAGRPELVGGRTVYRESPRDMAARVPDLVAAGARVVGGCCGTAPEHIRLFAAAVCGVRG